MSPLYGLLAEFDKSETLLAAVRRTRDEGYRCIDAHTPFPLEEMEEALGFSETRLGWIVSIAGAAGLAIAIWGMWYVDVDFLLIRIGGRPFASWPAYVVPGFEVTVLVAAIVAVVAMLVMNRLPRLNHPLFNVPRFARASQNRFFLLVRSDDPRFEPTVIVPFLSSLGAIAVEEVPR